MIEWDSRMQNNHSVKVLKAAIPFLDVEVGQDIDMAGLLNAVRPFLDNQDAKFADMVLQIVQWKDMLQMVQMMQQMIVGDAGKVVELIVVDEHREAFLDVLFDIVVQHGVALARAGSSQNQRRTKRIDDIDPSLPPLRLITITRRKVHRIIIAEATLFLKETFVFIIERIVGKRLFQQAPQPDPGGQQAEIPHSKGRNIAPCPKVGSGRQLQQHAVQKE